VVRKLLVSKRNEVMAKPQAQESSETGGAKTGYDKWVESEGIPIIKTFFVEDICRVKLDFWQRKGGNGAFLQMEGAGQVNNCYICEIPPGKSLKPQRQLFEETIYIIRFEEALAGRDVKSQMAKYYEKSL
jgi:hypothetical protein